MTLQCRLLFFMFYRRNIHALLFIILQNKILGFYSLILYCIYFLCQRIIYLFRIEKIMFRVVHMWWIFHLRNTVINLLSHDSHVLFFVICIIKSFFVICNIKRWFIVFYIFFGSGLDRFRGFYICIDNVT